MNNQRHVQGAFVNEVAVVGFAMIAQPFAMVGGDNHERPIPPAIALQRLPESPSN